jgi:hypothetical protein
MVSETLELKFTGGSVLPENISSSDLSDIIKSFELAVANVILKDHQELETQNIVISLVDIKKGSLKLEFLPKLKREALTAFLVITTAIQQNDYSSLPIKTIQSLQSISGFCKRQKCFSEFRSSSDDPRPLAVISPTTDIVISEELFLVGETTVYGTILRVGGAEPKVQLRLSDTNNILYCPIKKEIAKKIGKDLYDEIGLVGTATWEKATYRIVDFKIEDAFNVKKTSIAQSIKEASRLFGKYWKDVDDVIAEVSKIRGSFT